MDHAPAEERLIGGKEASQLLTEKGFPVAESTLAKLRCIGGGPLFQSFGRKPRYKPSDLLSWAASRSTGPRRSTSDKSVKRAA